MVEENRGDWCCWHDVYLAFPDFFDVLAYNDDEDSAQQGEAAAIGGEQFVIARQVGLEITGPSKVSIGDEQCYEVTLENEGENDVEGQIEVELLSGPGKRHGHPRRPGDRPCRGERASSRWTLCPMRRRWDDRTGRALR